MDFLAHLISSIVLLLVAVFGTLFGLGLIFFMNIPIDGNSPASERVAGCIVGTVVIVLALGAGFLGFQLQPFDITLKG